MLGQERDARRGADAIQSSHFDGRSRSEQRAPCVRLLCTKGVEEDSQPKRRLQHRRQGGDRLQHETRRLVTASGARALHLVAKQLDGRAPDRPMLDAKRCSDGGGGAAVPQGSGLAEGRHARGGGEADEAPVFRLEEDCALRQLARVPLHKLAQRAQLGGKDVVPESGLGEVGEVGGAPQRAQRVSGGD